MTTERFTQEQFEAALPKQIDFYSEWQKGELVYILPVFGNSIGQTNKRIVIRSSIRRDGLAADTDKDSIRHWVEYEYKDKWHPLTKASKAYTTRVPGWEKRLTTVLKELWLIALNDSKKGASNGSVGNSTGSDVSARKGEQRAVAHGNILSPSSDKDLMPDGNSSAVFGENDAGQSASSRDLSSVSRDNPSEAEPEDDDPFAFLETKQTPLPEPDRDDDGSDDGSGVGSDDGEGIDGIRQGDPVTVITLNPYQQAVVDALDGPQVVEAVPGSGKTRTLEYRVAYLIASGADPSRIGVFTFSNPAASEARYRIARTLWPNSTEDELAFFSDPFKNKHLVSENWVESDPARKMLVNWVCTIHAMSFRLLIEMGEKISVLSGKPQLQAKSLITDSLAEMRWKEGTDSIKAYISMAIRNLVEPANAQSFYSKLLAGTDVAWRARDLAEIYRRYYDFCRARKLVDFDMMQARVLKNLRTNPIWRGKAQLKFDYILVDEAQDTDFIQAEILWTLANQTSNIMFCGDCDQSMYIFRGARPSVLREDFAARWPDVKRFSLPVNYRSTHNIVKFASRLIGFNYEPDDIYLKDFQARQEAEEGVDLTYTELGTFDELAKEIAALVIDNPSDWFVLSRTRAECAAIHTELVRQGIPAINKSGGMLFGAPHVRKVLAYAMLACDHDNARDNLEVLSEIANVASIDFRAPFTRRSHLPSCHNNKGWVDCGCPTIMVEGQDCVTARYYGEKAIQAAGGWRGVVAQQHETNKGHYPTPRAKGAKDLVQFVEQLEVLRDDARTCLQVIISDSIQPWLDAKYGDDADLSENGANEDLDLLLSMVKPEQTMEQYLQEIDDLTQGGNGFDENESVIIGTAHWSKGAERERVICNVTRLPIVPPKHRPGHLPMGKPPTIEEERRLLYVMITRAKSECCIVAAREWNDQAVSTSRFVSELKLLSSPTEYQEESADEGGCGDDLN